MKITSELISKLEDLAQLSLNPDERKSLIGDLVKMIDMIRKIQDLDTSGTEPLIRPVDSENIYREDQVEGQLSQEDALRNAPSAGDGYFRVPNVM